MKGVVSSDVNFRRMGAGRHVFGLEQVAERVAGCQGLSQGQKDALRAQIERALKLGRGALAAELAYNQHKEGVSQARGEAVVIDRELDVMITDLRDFVAIRSRSASSEVSEAAARIEQTLFRRGVADVIRLSFEDQLGVMEAMIAEFGGALRDDVARVGLEGDVARFRGRVADFAEELRRQKTERTTWDQVMARREELHEATCLVAIMVLANFVDLDDVAAMETREHILAPLREQQARVLDAQRRRRAIGDVNPETGEEQDAGELSTEEADAPPPVVA
ncbi:hypothetical protein DL240_09620 [Lujinxingia litoralis]|uniref:Uncharacterized protein n=1 Tax=Lujinxingia litoralis TaxID=2211119 RepID=A0A328C8Y5_9DELT|nr:hypothetical protein [Lujinxingia litoralis]RAL23130.1 hypothetical protein DL240_09620 [Lujinxingia litoralis]